MAECAREFGWTINETLETPARALFVVLNAAREQKQIESALNFRSLVEIAAVPSQNKKYIDALLDYYTKRVEAFDEKPKSAGNVVPWELATQIIAENLAIKMRLDCGGQ